MTTKSPITCHILDASLGKPAPGVKVDLFRLSPSSTPSEHLISSSETNSDGRIPALVPPHLLAHLRWTDGGTFKIRFHTAAYFAASGGRESFYPWVDVVFQIPAGPEGHYHVPLLISPFSYTTYRGS